MRSLGGGCLRGGNCAAMHMCVYITRKIKENFDGMQHRLDVSVCRKLMKEVKCKTEKNGVPQGTGPVFPPVPIPFLNVRKKRRPGNDTDPLLTHTIIFWSNHAKASVNISEAFEEKWCPWVTQTPYFIFLNSIYSDKTCQSVTMRSV